MKRYLGIDYGDAYIGIALADHGSIAVPLDVIRMNDDTLQAVHEVVEHEKIDVIVVGWPLSLSGKENERTQKTDAFIAQLQKVISIPIVREDERLSSKAVIGQTRGSRIDAQSAALVLQSYIDRHDTPASA